MSDETSGLRAYVDELIAATNAGKINWKTVNPSTFVWEPGAPKNARVSLQRVDRTTPTGNVTRREIFYLFQAFDSMEPNTSPVVSVESRKDGELQLRFATLFELIKTGLSQKNLDFLRSILPSNQS
ncbi:MAG: hypothetical protein HY010_16825 [Acidobacteria bacterium]|nr:hypothetical protein [Acidobacteriota bacterium]